MTINPSPMDLTTLSACKSWLSNTSAGSDPNLQACLTAASIFFLRQTGRGPRNWQNATQSPFNEPVDYAETYDGISGDRLYLRNFPINSVSSLSISGYTVPDSSGQNQPGYLIDDSGRSILIRLSGYGYNTGGGVSGYGNFRGRGGIGAGRAFAAPPQTIQVEYNAGFSAVPVVDELHTVIAGWTANTAVSTGDVVSDGTYLQTAQNSGTTGTVAPTWSQLKAGQTKDGTTPILWINSGIPASPNMIVIQNDVTTLSDQGVKYFSTGNPLTKVSISPAQGQYFLVAPGTYLFNAADAGQDMLVSYTSAGTPADIVLAVIQLVSLNYKRRDWIGQRSVAMKDVGSTSYTLAIDPSIQAVILAYTRASLSS